jgi:transcription termination/antitermination protein NusA
MQRPFYKKGFVMKVKLDQQTIQTISLFQNLTGTNVIDSISNDEVYFVVAEGQYGLAIGKNGSKIKNAEKVFKKPIKIFEYAEDVTQFIKNIVPNVQDIKQEGDEITIRVKPSDRSRVIGKSGKNIKIINQFLTHLYGIKEMKVK